MTADDLLRKLNDQPFQPFRVKLSTSETIDVTRPGMAIVGDSSAVLPVSVRKSDHGFEIVDNWRTIALDHIVMFQDLPPAKTESRRGKK